jgi:thioredoxin reductase (NADPH)
MLISHPVSFMQILIKMRRWIAALGLPAAAMLSPRKHAAQSGQDRSANQELRMSMKPPALEHQAFPLLSAEQIALLRPFGEVRQTQAGDVLFEVGDRDYPFVVVLSGETEVVDRSEGIDRHVTTGPPGHFHGELGLLTGQTVFAAGVVRQPGEVLVISQECVREIINTIPELSDLLITAFAARRKMLMRAAASTLTLIGRETSPNVLRLEEFVHRNAIPHRWLAPDDPTAVALLQQLGATGNADVWVIVRGQKAMADPSNLYLAKALGLDLAVWQNAPADLVVVGAGPAGLAAAVFAASEGLSTIAVDDVAIGGQAGTSSRIENYLGFPTGIAGGDLAFRGEVQALKFGARITVPRRATALRRENGHYVVRLDDKSDLRGRSVVIATGARYRRLDLPGQEAFEGAGIFYAATEIEARFCRNGEVVVVGGGNSAGQAAMFLASTAKRVHLVYRGPDLGHSMSRYLVTRLEHAPNVRIHTTSEVVAIAGDGRLDSVTVVNGDATAELIACRGLFVMIGADPCTDWLRGTLALDEQGFIVTGAAVADGRPAASLFETSLPGVFAAGDVRGGSVKRVASAVGEGSVVIASVHQYLASREAAAP